MRFDGGESSIVFQETEIALKRYKCLQNTFFKWISAF